MILRRRSENCITSTPHVDNTPLYVPKRYVFCLLAFMGVFTSYSMRVNMSIAMLAMVNRSTDAFRNYTSHQECPMLISDDIQEEKYKGKRYDWDAKTQGLILGSFFYGYVLTQLPGGYLADKSSAKWVFAISVAVPSILFFFTPFITELGAPFLIVAQVLQGLIQGALQPSLTSLITRWSPIMERCRMTAFIYGGVSTGTVVALLLSGWLCSSDLFGGWPSTYYLFGPIGIIWFFACAAYVYDSPDNHPSISNEEKRLIQNNIKDMHQKITATPWKEIFTSCPVWAYVICYIGDEFGFIMLLTELPNYLQSILHYRIHKNGLVSCLPHISEVICSWLVSYFADKLTEFKRLNITSIRKIMTLIGMILPAICLLGVTISGCQAYIIISLLIIAAAFNGFVFSGIHVVLVDMCPDFSGTVLGLANTVAYIFAASSPVIVGYLTESGATIRNWNQAFYITAAVYILGAVFFVIFGSAEEQIWAKQEKSKNPVTELQQYRND